MQTNLKLKGDMDAAQQQLDTARGQVGTIAEENEKLKVSCGLFSVYIAHGVSMLDVGRRMLFCCAVQLLKK
jgi:hypothetical protein